MTIYKIDDNSIIFLGNDSSNETTRLGGCK